ncbi:hypothetical protein ACFOYW_07425 [Gryllotalpicola reticulitermitis]|uniref:Integral membrane protein n=1 Tax=Gryllotalpicola reticulitermitis TaxID=1184153 RepID=A0ABV8Q6Y3_9MICO
MRFNILDLFNPLSIFKLFRRGTGGTVPEQRMQAPEVRRAFRTLRGWALTYLITAALALVASFVIPHASTGGTIGVWIRCGVVVLISAIIYALSLRAQRGHRSSYRTLRVFAWLESIGCILVALIVPGYPIWLRAATIVIGVFAVGTAVTAGSRRIRRAFELSPAITEGR